MLLQFWKSKTRLNKQQKTQIKRNIDQKLSETNKKPTKFKTDYRESWYFLNTDNFF